MPLPALAGLIGRGIAAFGSRAAAGEAASMSASSMTPAGGAGGGVAANLEKVTQAFGALSQVTKAALEPIGAFKDGLQSLSQHFSGAIDNFTLLADTIGGLGNKIAPFISAANPGKVEQFNLAMRDFHAVLGKALMPAMESFTRIARKVGDVFAQLQPIFEEFFAQVGGFFEDVFEGIANALKANAPLIDFALKAIGGALRVFGKILKGIFESIGPIVRSVLGFDLGALGFGSKMNPNASAQGAAVRNVSIGGSGSDLYKSASEKAFMQGSKAEKPVDYLKNIADQLGDDKIKDYVGWLAIAIVKAIKQQATEVVDAAADTANTIASDPMEFMRVLRDMVYHGD
jgi:hypothetical protein